MADSPWDMLSAIGTLAAVAVAVALGVSGHAAWTTRRAENDRAQLAAAKMLNPLRDLERKASYLFAWIAFGEEEQSYENAVKAMEELVTASKAISIDDLYPLLKLPKHAAKRSARALGLVQTFVNDATATINHPKWAGMQHADKFAHCNRWLVMLSELKDLLTVAVGVCETAASIGAPIPSSEEIHG